MSYRFVRFFNGFFWGKFNVEIYKNISALPLADAAAAFESLLTFVPGNIITFFT